MIRTITSFTGPIAPLPIDELPRISAQSATVRSARYAKYIRLMLLDTFAIVFSFLFANAVYIGDIWASHGTILSAVTVPIFLFVAAILDDVYSQHAIRHPRRAYFEALRSFTVAAAIALFVGYFAKATGEFSRVVFAISLLLTPVLMLIFRIVEHYATRSRSPGTGIGTVIIVDGDARIPETPASVVDAKQIGFDPRIGDATSFHRLALAIGGADRIIISTVPERQAEWGGALKALNRRGEIFTHNDDPIGILGFDDFGGLRTLVVAISPLSLKNRMVKRTYDIAVSLTALILLFPLLLATAIAVKLDSRGPVLFAQNRIGRDNRLFKVYKFRSMATEHSDHAAAALTTRNDPRVTRVGAFIRRTSIDELPQLFNVLRGTMSIVGPRPHPVQAKASDRLYWEVDPRYWLRHSIKPGLTGLAQVRGFRGNTEKIEDLTGRLFHDMEYLNNWSISRDILITLQTFAVFKHDNAY